MKNSLCICCINFGMTTELFLNSTSFASSNSCCNAEPEEWRWKTASTPTEVPFLGQDLVCLSCRCTLGHLWPGDRSSNPISAGRWHHRRLERGLSDHCSLSWYWPFHYWDLPSSSGLVRFQLKFCLSFFCNCCKNLDCLIFT